MKAKTKGAGILGRIRPLRTLLKYPATALFGLLLTFLWYAKDGWLELTPGPKTLTDRLACAFALGLVGGMLLPLTKPGREGSPRARFLLALLPSMALALLGYFLPEDRCAGLLILILCLCVYFYCAGVAPEKKLCRVALLFLLSAGVTLVVFLLLYLLFSALFLLVLQDAGAGPIFLPDDLLPVLGFLFAPLLFLSLLDAPEPREDSRLQKGISLVVLPLALLLFAVLITYVAGILARRQMPAGVMNGYALGALALFTALQLTLSGRENRLSALFKRQGGWLLLPVTAAQGVGLYIRWSAYGLTPNRILGFALALVSLSAVVVSLLRRPVTFVWPLLGVLAVLLMSSPLNADELARWNQEKALQEGLARHDMLTETAIRPAAGVPEAEQVRMEAALSYLLRADAPEGSFARRLQEMADKGGIPRDALFPDTRRTENYFVRSGSASHDQLDCRGIARARWVDISLDVLPDGSLYAKKDPEQDYGFVADLLAGAPASPLPEQIDLPGGDIFRPAELYANIAPEGTYQYINIQGWRLTPDGAEGS